MHKGYIPFVCMLLSAISIFAQENDSIRTQHLDAVVVVGQSAAKSGDLNSVLSVEVAGKDFLHQHYSGSLMQTLGQIPGVHSMDIGSGFSKPMIRGMGFNRISVTENGIKQEGQQWGADHGLEIDAFNVERVTIRKGPSSLLYGSDAMGGAIEITQLPAPIDNQVLGEVVLAARSVNESFDGSIMLGIKKDRWFTKLRYTEKHFGDYKVPTDSILYLTRYIPIYGRKLKNTAGFERDASFYTEYRNNRYHANYAVSNAYQKVGFFPGAHGIPDASRVEDDGDSRNIGLPYSRVNHLKATTRQQYMLDGVALDWNMGYQNNFRQEMSLFHTHYGSQPVPETDPDKELEFRLQTFSSSAKVRLINSQKWEHTAGWDVQYQQNRIGGYSFLLPEYNRFTTGVLWLSTYRPSAKLTISGGIRYDFGRTKISAYEDEYLVNHLQQNGYSDELIEEYKWRSYAVDRSFGDVSASLGIVWNIGGPHLLKANIGRSFRLPGANELASNGVHHGTFRHEQGDASLSSEKGWQLDVSYMYERSGISLSVSPFASWFSNYIHLKPTGQSSVLPHAGQIYRYTGAEAVFAGGEVMFGIDFLRRLNYSFAGEYVYTYNVDENLPVTFSPPASMRNTLTWKGDSYNVYAEVHSIARQNRINRNEDPTPGANLLNAGATFSFPLGGNKVDVTLSAQNLLNTRYYNHLSFYRRVEIPEPGRNLQLVIKIPFNSIIK